MAEHIRDDAARTRLREAFARRTGTDARDWHLVFKARYGMREVFAAARALYGAGEVVTTLFTGCTAVDAILAAGLAPRYDAIDPDTLSLDVDALEVGERVRAVILQHSYGIVDTRAATECARRSHEGGALFMEDSAHCVARMARDASGTPLADVSVHSLGIEKQFSIGFGGAIWVNPRMPDVRLRDAITEQLEGLPELPARLESASRHYHTQNRVLAHLPRGLAGTVRSSLLASGRFEPPVAETERRGGLPYPSYQPSEWIAGQIAGALERIDEDEATRRAWVAGYADALEGAPGLRTPAGALGVGRAQSLIRFPVLLGTEEAARELIGELRARGFYCVDWYRVPFYPGAADLSAYGTSESDEAYRRYRETYGGIVGLPADLDPTRLPEALEIVRRHLP